MLEARRCTSELQGGVQGERENLRRADGSSLRADDRPCLVGGWMSARKEDVEVVVVEENGSIVVKYGQNSRRL